MKFKELIEKRKLLQAHLLDLVNKADGENRAMSAEEQKYFNDTEQSIKDIDATINAEKRAQDMQKKDEEDDSDDDDSEEARAAADEAIFESMIRGYGENRASGNITESDNTSVIPSTIANRIIEVVKTICPLYELSEKFHVKGTLNFPIEDDANHIEMAYADEFVALTSTKEHLTNVSLTGFLAGALSKVSKSLINNAQFPIVDYVIKKMAEATRKFLEKEFITGTANKITGLSTVDQIVTAALTTSITADELIDTQEAVPDQLQDKAIWIMHKTTRKAIRKLKDSDGNYLLTKDNNSRWGFTIFGKDVYCSDQMPQMAAGNKAIYYGDPSGIYTNIHEDINIEVLREKYADEHAVGVIGWLEVDAKLIEKQKMSCLQMHA